MSRQSKPAVKKAEATLILKGALRAKFKEKERLLRHIEAVDVEVKQLLRRLADEEGVPFLREEKIRVLVMDSKGEGGRGDAD